LPEYSFTDPPPDQPDATPTKTLVGPIQPTAVPTTAEELVQLASSRIDDLQLARPDDLTNWTPDSSSWGVFYPGYTALSQASLALLPGLAILLFGIWFLDTGRGGESLRPIAVPAATAAAMPHIPSRCGRRRCRTRRSLAGC
jgi:hypothetical protein